MAPVAWCLLAALLFGASTPVAKALLAELGPWELAGFLYLGAAIATLPFALRGGSSRARFTPTNVRALGGAVLFGGVLGPFALLAGLDLVPASAAALWLNLETVFTTLFALVLFRESVDRGAWPALLLIVGAGVLLAAPFEPGTLRGGLFIAAACAFWGLDNNFTSVIDGWTPTQTTAVKGAVAGAVNLAIGWRAGVPAELDVGVVALALLVGGLAYGASIVLYIQGAQQLGAGRSQMLFSTAPFAGVAIAALAFGEALPWTVFAAGALMALGLGLLLRERHGHVHHHHAVVHTHRHRHDDGHHTHTHDAPVEGWHTHEHEHEPIEHEHPHRPDIHHRHAHALLLAALLLVPAIPGSALAVAPPGVRSRLIVEGEPRPGGELPVKVEVSWPGRPEKFNVGVPRLRVPEDAAVRLGGTGSQFTRGRTKWWTETVVTLPDWDGPWMLGPAEVDILGPGGATEPIEVAAKRVRQKRRAGLLGRGLGSAVVLAIAAGFVLRLYRSLGETPAARRRERWGVLLDTCTRACEAGSPAEFLQAALALVTELEARGAAPSGLSSGELAERLDRVRFGGEEMGADACREVLDRLSAAASS